MAIILDVKTVGESDYSCRILTKELGLLNARARSARALKSKLRYALQKFSISEISLVKGRSGWKIVGAISKINPISNLKNTKTITRIGNVFVLIRRFVPANETDGKIFNLIYDGLIKMSSQNTDHKREEIVLVAKILHTLGYISEDIEDLSKMSNTLLIESINKAIMHADL